MSCGLDVFCKSLYSIVYLLMTKLYERLVAEFRKLGAMIVYADFYRVVICTNRTVFVNSVACGVVTFIRMLVLQLSTWSILSQQLTGKSYFKCWRSQ